MNLDLTQTPFASFGSYLAFSQLAEAPGRPAGLYLRSVHGPATGGRPMQEILRMELLSGGASLPFQVEASPSRLALAAADGRRAELCFEGARALRVRVQGAALRFEMPAGDYDNVIPAGPDQWRLTVNTVLEMKLAFTALAGSIEVDAPWNAEHSEHIRITLVPGADGRGEFALDESTVNWEAREHRTTFEDCAERVARELADFTGRLPALPARLAEARELAGYILWSCAVAPEGHLGRPTLYASKNGMLSSWSWDHCFHALALSGSHPRLAWDQLMALFDHQDESGALPDLINDRLVSWSFCKPPVHGWLLARMLQQPGLATQARLAEIYGPLTRWTEWWFAQRDDDQDGLPQCNHGNDGGWDNSTVFAARPPVETPEIAAYLVLQMETLASLAQTLGKPAEAGAWRARAADLTDRMLAHFWRGDHFVAVQVQGHSDLESRSLLLTLPLLLGERLPRSVREALIRQLKAPGEFLTPYGLATESLKSPLYRPRGYWRGPIWAAPTLVLVDALFACGEAEFARSLRANFVELAAARGFAENFDAQTGQGYHDLHFSWTAGIWLTLAHEMFPGGAG